MAGPSSGKPAPVGLTLRLDKWLWQARFFKTRALAADFIAEGHLRVNGQPISRPGRDIAPGDTLTFPLGSRVRLIRVVSLGHRRGPAAEAQLLYLDLDAAPGASDTLE